jgi:diguanylate cyclase (GGDEF)-like protein
MSTRAQRTAGVWGLTALLATAALAIWMTTLRALHATSNANSNAHSHTHVPWLLVAAAFYLAEANVVHVYRRGDAHTFSLSEVPLVVGLFFLSPAGLVTACLAGAGTALVLHRRQRPTKLCFNLAHFALSAVLAELVFHAALATTTTTTTTTPTDIGVGTWMPLAAAAFVGALVGAVAVQTVIAISQGRLPTGDVKEATVLGGVATVVNASLGIIAVSLAWDHPANTWALAVPLVIVVVAYRAYLAEREKRTGLQFLYQSAQLLQATNDVGDATARLLGQVCTMFRSQRAELVLFPGGDGSRALRATVTAEGDVHPLGRGHLDPADLVLASLASDGQGVFVHNGRVVKTSRLARLTRRSPRRTPIGGMVATLDADRGPFGMLCVHDRLDAVSAFDNDELRLLQTLANHVATALANGQLKQSLSELRTSERELRQQALHDPLTGLGNRSLFGQRVREAVAARKDSASAAVIFIDLDDFKSVNDTFGHQAGDEVLRQTAERIRDCLRPSDTAARLGGDEFAVLLPDVPDSSRAMAVAQRIREAVEAPVQAGDHVIVVSASLGVSLGTAESARVDDMVERADAAMYQVKAAGKGDVQLVETGA